MSEKNGGPYTKPEQEERRRKVYEMHFEKSQSALHIANVLGVNRNTINEDIRHLYSELACEFEKLEIHDLMIKQHSRLEQQRERLVSLLEKQQDVSTILKIERMLYDIDRAITKMIEPIMSAQGVISEKEATETIEFMMINDDSGKVNGYTTRKMLQDIIQYRKCDARHAQKILDRIIGLGLGLYENQRPLLEQSYDMLGFAETRNILSDDKLREIYSKLEKRQEEQKQEIKERELRDAEIEKIVEKEFIERYGPKSGWDVAILKDYHRRIDYFDG